MGLKNSKKTPKDHTEIEQENNERLTEQNEELHQKGISFFLYYSVSDLHRKGCKL